MLGIPNYTNCSGSSLNVTYTVSGSYGAGNLFTVQLSDSLGSFVNPVNIGSVTTIKDSLINCIIPFSTLPSINYRIRVVSSSPLVLGSNNGSNITINSAMTLTVNSGTICSGNSFTIAPSGASTYTYSSSSNIVSPLFNTTYTVTGTDASGCIGSVLSSVSVDTLVPTLAIIGNNSVCIGSNANLLANGANSYTWSSGALTPSVSLSQTINTSYTLTGTNACGIATATVSVIIDPACADIWPGDANSNGIADNLDVLELGLHYTQTGAPRATTSNNWQSYFSNNWGGTISNGKNLNHSDCNGDGTINDDDTLAIFNNYGLTHTFKTAQTTTVNPQLNIISDQAIVDKGKWGTASIYLGDVSNSISNINGLAYSITYDNTLIELDSIYVDYTNSFFNPSNQNLNFRKRVFSSGIIFTASTHTLNNNVSGNGQIATLHYKINSSITTDQTLTIGLIQANQSDSSGNIVPLTSGTATLLAKATFVGLQEFLKSNSVSISPNPTSGVLNITFSTIPQNTKIEVYNSIGALVLTETLSNKYSTINTSQLSNGMYMIKVLENNRIITVQKIVKQ